MPAAGSSQTLTVIFTPFDTTDYAAAVQTVQLNVVPASLTITAASAFKVEGQPNPAFAVQYSGFVQDQGPANLNGSLVFTTPATASSPAGSYPIIPAGLSSPNYSIGYVDGTLAVTPTPPPPPPPPPPPSIPPVTVFGLQWQTEKLARKRSVKVLEIFFSGALDPGSADNPAAYVLDAVTNRKKQGTRYKPIPFSNLSYSPALVTLVPRGKVPNQKLQLTINASLVLDAEGRQIVGNEPGGKYATLLNNRGIIDLALPSVHANRISAEAFDALLATGRLPKTTRPSQGHRHSTL